MNSVRMPTGLKLWGMTLWPNGLAGLARNHQGRTTGGRVAAKSSWLGMGLGT